MRKTMIALLAAASVAMLTPGMASAHGPGGGGFGGHAGGGGFGGHPGGGSFGGHPGGGFGGHFGGGGFHHGGFGPGFGFGFGVGYPYYSGYPYYDAYPDEDSCYVVHHRVHTRYGWRYRRVVVCD